MNTIHGDGFTEQDFLHGTRNIYDSVITQAQALILHAKALKYEARTHTNKKKNFFFVFFILFFVFRKKKMFLLLWELHICDERF